MVMAKNEFYALVLKKKIKIPESKIKFKVKSGRRFAVGTYSANGKTYEAWKILGMVKPKK
jgi:ribosomal protein L13E